MSEEYGNDKVLSRDCQIVKSIVEGTEYNDPPRSEEEYWLLKLKAAIEDDPTIEPLTATDNGTYSEQGKAYSPVTVAVPLGTKNITANGTYDATDDSLKGYSSVSVDVPLPENAYLKKDLPTGAIATVTDAEAEVMPSLKIAITPVQDLHGYENPWPEGGNINLLPPGEEKTVTVNGVTFASDGNGFYSVSGSASSDTIAMFSCEEFSIPENPSEQQQPYTFFQAFNNAPQNAKVFFVYYYKGDIIESWLMSPINRVSGYIAQSGRACDAIGLKVLSGTQVNMTIKPMIYKGSADNPPNWSPYSNICPITGWNEANITVTDGDTETHVTTIPFDV